MNWLLLSLLSSFFLGLYEIAKKESLRGNAVPPVLFFNVLTSTVVYTPIILISHVFRDEVDSDWIVVDALSWNDHLLLAAKSLLAGSSWIFASFALKHLPVSIAAPIRASSPFVTIMVAVAFMHERPTAGQWAGIGVVLAAFYSFSLVGKKEGIVFHKNRWIACMAVATLLGACSSLYDKYLLSTCGYRTATVQAWFSIYLVPVMLPLLLRWYLHQRKDTPFQWRWSIPMIALLLLVSDFLYFYAIEQPGGLISLISPLRRTSVIIAFIAGIRMYGEQNWRSKALCIAALMVGIGIITMFSA